MPIGGESSIPNNQENINREEYTIEDDCHSYSEEPIPYSQINVSEHIPFLHHTDNFDPPPDYNDPDAFAELPTYEQIQEECK